MKERKFAFGKDRIEEDDETCECPIVAAGLVDDTKVAPRYNRVAGYFDEQIAGFTGPSGVVDEPEAREAWDQVLDHFEDQREEPIAREVANKLGWNDE
jgi:hypothetical protein